MKRLPIFIIAVLAAALAATASGAGISVLKTSFDTQADFDSIKSLSGPAKNCKRDWRDNSALGVTVKAGPFECVVSTPVSGDSPQPNQIVRAAAKENKDTDKKVRKTMYLGVVVRGDSTGGYELRIYPKARTFELIRNGAVIDDGREKTINGMADKNKIQLEVQGSTLTGKVNGETLTTFKDKDADEVDGRQTGLSFGNTGRSKKALGVGLFDNLKVQLPVKK